MRTETRAFRVQPHTIECEDGQLLMIECSVLSNLLIFSLMIHFSNPSHPESFAVIHYALPLPLSPLAWPSPPTVLAVRHCGMHEYAIETNDIRRRLVCY